MAEVKKTSIACRACRARKVKCSKDVPQYSNCEKYAQLCLYPLVTMKPGPKPGSIHQKRYSRRSNLQRRCEGIPASNLISTCTICEETGIQCARQMQTVSDLCKVTKESLPASPSGLVLDHTVAQRSVVLLGACDALAVSLNSMERMLVPSAGIGDKGFLNKCLLK